MSTRDRWDRSDRPGRAPGSAWRLGGLFLGGLAVTLVLAWSAGGYVLSADSLVPDRQELDIARDGDRRPEPLPRIGEPPWVPPSPGFWEVLPAAPVGSRVGHTLAAIGPDIVTWGGYQQGRPLDNGAIFDSASGSWRPIPDSPTAERGHVGVAAGRTLLLMEEYVPMAYDTEQSQWRMLPGPPLDDGVLLSQVSAWTGRSAVVLTAHANGDPGPALAFDVVRDTWTELAPPPVTISNDHALIWNGRELLLFGRAEDTAAFAHRLSFGASDRRGDPTSVWEALPAPPLRPDVASTASVRAVMSGSVRAGHPAYVWIGPRPGGAERPQLLSLVEQSGAWRWQTLASPPIDEPVPELFWTGSDVLAIGPGDAAQYDAAGNTFFRLPPVELPGGQQRAAAWTGEFLMWWGGATGDGAGWRPTGAVEDPSVLQRLTDICSGTPASGCPYDPALP